MNIALFRPFLLFHSTRPCCVLYAACCNQAKAPPRRTIKTHAPAHLAPWKMTGAPALRQHFGVPGAGKVIVVIRNPKDAAVSLFHHSKDVPIFHYTGLSPAAPVPHG